jgi:hypothetical protein
MANIAIARLSLDFFIERFSLQARLRRRTIALPVPSHTERLWKSAACL